MLPWNRKEVYLGSSMQEFCEVRDTLSANHIRFGSRTVDHNATASGTRGTMGRFAEDPEHLYQYYVYVNNKDYENAKYLLNQSV
jgi:hypothetical protein